MSSANLEQCWTYWRERCDREDGQNRARRNAMLALLPRVASALRRFGVTRVWLTGSLARGDFQEGSDIDLVVEGLPEQQCFRAKRAAQQIAGVWVDLLRFEDLEPLRREIVLGYCEEVTPDET